jgi:predicted enzyme related to lactoylglutathione lyase
MFKITGLRSWNLNADDFAAMVGFYRDGLGVEEAGRQNIAGNDVVRLRAGAQGIGLFDAAKGATPGVPHHTLAVEGPADADALTRELESKGIKVDAVRQHQEDAGFSVYVIDPSGNRLELSVAR